jgi:WD40 repeat protein
VFLTCSADWTVQLWDVNTDVKSSFSSSSLENESLMTFRQTNLKDSVNDVAWSPFSATTFASIASDGRIEIWDLSVNTADPIITHFNDKVEVIVDDVPEIADGDDNDEGDEKKGEEDEKDLLDTLKPKEDKPEKRKVTYEALKLTCLAFSENSNAIAVGDHRGAVSIYQVPVSCEEGTTDDLRAVIEAEKRTKLHKEG